MTKAAPNRIYDTAKAEAYARRRRPEPDLVDRLAAALAVPAGAACLDVGCGTGNYTGALAARHGPDMAWTGVDPSAAMLAAAQRQNPNLDLRQAAAEHLPFETRRFAGVISVLALHHFPDLSAAFAEIRRVLKSDGRLVVFTATREQAEGFWLRLYLPRMMAADAATLPRLVDITAAAEAAGFAVTAQTGYAVGAQPRERFFFSGRRRPEFYLDAGFRAANSVFQHADTGELEAGLAALQADIARGVWAARVAAHEKATQSAHVGDYSLLTFVPSA